MLGKSDLWYAIGAAALVALAATTLAAQDSALEMCEPVLAPTLEISQSDYRYIQAYMYVNAEKEWDRLDKNRSNNNSGNVIYKAFAGEFHSSNSKSEFSQRVRERLVKENFTLDVSEARSHYRSGFTDVQVQSWGDCINAITRGGYVKLSTGGPVRVHDNLTAIPIKLFWSSAAVDRRPPKIKVRIIGGEINGRSTYERRMSFNSGSLPLTIVRDPRAQAVVLTASSGNHSETIKIDLSEPPKMVLTREERLCAESDNCQQEWPIILACLPSAETGDWPSGGWLIGPQHPEYDKNASPRTNIIRYGDWSNSQCGVRGSGWHAHVGSCRVGRGTRLQRCNYVKAARDVLRPQRKADES